MRNARILQNWNLAFHDFVFTLPSQALGYQISDPLAFMRPGPPTWPGHGRRMGPRRRSYYAAAIGFLFCRTARNAIGLERAQPERAHHLVFRIGRAETHVLKGRTIFHPSHPLARVDHGRGLLAKLVFVARLE